MRSDPANRVILSRKGFDASAGGHPSPILPGGRLLSLPIPEAGTGAPYAELRTPWGQTYGEVLTQLRVRRLTWGTRRFDLDGATEAHLDPDLVRTTRPRGRGWRPAFGQAGAAQTVLARAGVGPGDLFLFFGWFKPTPEAAGDLGLDPRRQLHVLWGWLRVGQVLTVEPGGRHPAHRDHPHVVRPARPSNTLYVAADEAVRGVPGAGVFDFAPSLVLTAPDGPGRATWRLPSCLHPSRTTVLARHAARFGEPGRQWVGFDARFQWQEFVAGATPAVAAWAESLLPR